MEESCCPYGWVPYYHQNKPFVNSELFLLKKAKTLSFNRNPLRISTKDHVRFSVRQMFPWFALKKEADRFIKRKADSQIPLWKIHHKFFWSGCFIWLLSWTFQFRLQPCLFHFESHWGTSSRARLPQVKRWVGQGWRAAKRVGILAPNAYFYAIFQSPWHYLLYHELPLIPSSFCSKQILPPWLYSGIHLLGQCLAWLHMCSYYWNLIVHSRMRGCCIGFSSVDWLGREEDDDLSTKTFFFFLLLQLEGLLCFAPKTWRKKAKTAKPTDFPPNQHILCHRVSKSLLYSFLKLSLDVVMFCVASAMSSTPNCGLPGRTE